MKKISEREYFIVMAAVPAKPGEKPIEKKTFHAGKGPELDFPKGTKVKFHFVTKLEDKVLDDSRKWDKPMELVFGKKFKLEAWELCLATMRLNEVSSFKVKPVYSAVYPAVAKTLRDTFNKLDKHGHPKKPGEHQQHQHHVCGMMAMQNEGGVMGYDDLNELMKEPRELEFIIELLSIELPDEYAKESWQLDVDEKLTSVSQLRSEGNQLYSNKKLEEATEKYGEAIGRLEQLILREKPQDDEWLELRKQKVPLLLNYSQCKLSLNDYYSVIKHCSEVLDEIDENNVKALFRRAKAHVGAWNPEEAREDFNKVMDLDPSLTIACTKELKNLERLEKEHDSADKDKFKKLF